LTEGIAMSTADPPPRWYAPWRRAEEPAPAAAVDPADLGTAYGLDLSMAPLPSDPPDTPTAEPELGWQRLTTRRKTGA
jgi:hypothetical protein